MNHITSCYLAGLKFKPEEVIKSIYKDLVLKLEAEPNNPYDQNAIKVLGLDGMDIGYVPKKTTIELHPYRIAQVPIFTVIANYIPEMPTYRQVLITVRSVEELPKYIPEEKEEELFKNFICLDKLPDK